MRLRDMLILCATLALCLQTAGAAGDAILSCKNPYASSRIEIIENPSRRGAILRWHTYTGIDTYQIEERTPAYYRFVEADPKTPDSASRILIDRVTGALRWTTYISDRARRVLLEACAGEIDAKRCASEMETIPGGNPFACSSPSEADCARWQEGDNVLAAHPMQCVRLKPRF